MGIGHRKEIRKRLQSLYDGQFTLSTQLKHNITLALTFSKIVNIVFRLKSLARFIFQITRPTRLRMLIARFRSRMFSGELSF